MGMYDIMVLNVSMHKQYNGCLEIGEETSEKTLNIVHVTTTEYTNHDQLLSITTCFQALKEKLSEIQCPYFVKGSSNKMQDFQ